MNHYKFLVSTILILHPLVTHTLDPKDILAQPVKIVSAEVNQSMQQAKEHANDVLDRAQSNTTSILEKVESIIKNNKIKYDFSLNKNTIQAIGYFIIVLAGSCGLVIGSTKESWSLIAANSAIICAGMWCLKNLNTSPKTEINTSPT